MIVRKCGLILLGACIAFTAQVAQADTPESTQPGIAKSKPATGPSVQVADGFMVPYTITVPGSDVTIEMIPVPGGVVTMGSPKAKLGIRATKARK